MVTNWKLFERIKDFDKRVHVEPAGCDRQLKAYLEWKGRNVASSDYLTEDDSDGNESETAVADPLGRSEYFWDRTLCGGSVVPRNESGDDEDEDM